MSPRHSQLYSPVGKVVQDFPPANTMDVTNKTIVSFSREFIFRLKGVYLALPPGAMCCGQNPLVRYQHSGTVEYLVRTAEDRGQKRPVSRQRRSPAYYPRLAVHGLRSSPHATLCMNNNWREGNLFLEEINIPSK